ncbi:pyruvate kinase [Planomonospora sp. ID91781]|uniref:Pyruvate kinase n=3 Tax=Planomonospora TaxID=1998 RepID=A0A171B7R1_9ACTN|nr:MULTISPECIES: pyruvate kinase [Planomonospora]MBG0822126.1 pyruvate kinase [Planomonospora sp. ID91781]GAT64750.1 pyruvate kinase [Planomonospora sphaerica]GGK48424.1 pyruvate kinase [Planomonospora parontospora]GII06709.1 pyruvate kinase [Planomonospora parontospora subsp. parontospora]
MTRRAKIVCTLGPATSSPERLRELIAAGMDVARFNLSHGSHELHKEVYDRVREAAAELGRGVGVLADLQGPKIRVGRFEDGPVRLGFGDVFTITTEDVPGDREQVSTTYLGLPKDVRPGDSILVDDGRVHLEVTRVEGPRVTTRVVIGGMISDNKGLNLPGVDVSAPALTDKDEADLRWALRTGFDMIALSFVRRPSDAHVVRNIMEQEAVRLPLLAKIEKPQAVDLLPEIVEAFDGIMVARGDLGVELPLEDVPIVQKRAIELCREKARPVIVATQMLDSMMSAPRPTRAEASDVAYAVMDGADAVMLSGETSVGTYPIESVETMSRIASAAERSVLEATHSLHRLPETTGGAIARAAAEVGAIVGAKALVAFTMSGETARRLARYRSPIPLLAFTSASHVRNQLALVWGVETFEVPFVHHTDDMVRQVEAALLTQARLEKGDKVVIVAGSPPGHAGTTNALRVHTIGAAV